VRDVEPGEMLVMGPDGITSYHPFPPAPSAHCIFEHVYFARPDSYVFGQSVNEVRTELGRRLARERVSIEDGAALLDAIAECDFADPAAVLALFAVPQNLSTDARPVARAVDGAGNVQEVPLPVLIKGRKFPERQLQVDDAFMQRKVPEILTAVGKPVPTDLEQGYLTVNRDVRRESEERLQAITARSADHPLWSGVFQRQSNAAPMSAFADRRSYLYGGEVIDRQTHLGYDLASLKNAPVEATQDGVVVFADYLGIYGNTVVVDHGFGVFSLYGHLSSIGVQPGQQVRARDSLGQTGETGLAGGDHLHFSIMLRGVHVDPVEWWDPLWMRDHIAARLASLPAAPPAAVAQPADAAPPAAAGDNAIAHGEAQP